MESTTRLMFVNGGLPEPEINATVLDEHGAWVAEVDFLWREAQLIAEFQGRFHAGAQHRESDECRRALLEGLGYRVRFMWAETVLDAKNARSFVEWLRIQLTG